MNLERTAETNPRVEASLPFVEALARRMASTMPHSIDLGDLVQDGVLGLIDAAERFDEARGIKFETFAERRVRGAMIDALRRDAWPRGVRRIRREIEAARDKLRGKLGYEPSLADLAAEIGSDEKRLGRTIVRINTIESTSPLSCAEHLDEAQLPAVLVPTEPDRPDQAFERVEAKDRVREAIRSLPPRERRLIGLYYYGEVTMKEIGAELGVNESRVSQLHARALGRLREALGTTLASFDCAEGSPEHRRGAPLASALRSAILPFEHKPRMAKAVLNGSSTPAKPAADRRNETAVVVAYASVSRAARSKSPSRKGFDNQRHPVSSRKRSASVPATSPVTKMTRRANPGIAAAMAR